MWKESKCKSLFQCSSRKYLLERVGMIGGSETDVSIQYTLNVPIAELVLKPTKVRYWGSVISYLVSV
jgi:hypothetical protein